MEKKNKIISLTSVGVGVAIFVTFLVLFILSYSVDSGDWGMDISASKDYLVVLVSGIILVLLNSFPLVNKEDSSLRYLNISLLVNASIYLCYSLTRIIKLGIKGDMASTTWYFVWLAVSLILFVVSYLLCRVNRKEVK